MKPYLGTAEDVVDRLRTYLKVSEEYEAICKRLGSEWPIPQDAKAAEVPVREKLSAAYRDMQRALSNYDFATTR